MMEWIIWLHDKLLKLSSTWQEVRQKCISFVKVYQNSHIECLLGFFLDIGIILN